VNVVRATVETVACTSKVEGAISALLIAGMLMSGLVVTSQPADAQVATASIGDRVWLDANSNGLQDPGESGVRSISVVATDAAGVFAGVATTDSSGAYLIEDLPAGTYTLEFRIGIEREFTQLDVGVDDAVDSDVSADGETGPVTVDVGEAVTGIDAGLLPDRSGLISGVAWEDANSNGLQEADESPAEGVRFNLWRSEGGEPTVRIDGFRTRADGVYAYVPHRPGEYQIEVELPTRRSLTMADAGDDTIDSDIDPATRFSSTFVLDPNGEVSDIDAGLVPPSAGAIGGVVWEDRDGDGIQDANEPPEDIFGNVQLWESVNGQPTVAIDFVSPDNSGAYLFSDLADGEYQLEFGRLTGRVFTIQDAGDDDELDSDVDPATGLTPVLTIADGAQLLSTDAGYLERARGSVRGQLWDDIDGGSGESVRASRRRSTGASTSRTRTASMRSAISALTTTRSTST